MKIILLAILIASISVGCSSKTPKDLTKEINKYGERKYYSNSLDSLPQKSIVIKKIELDKQLSIPNATSRIRLVELITSSEVPRYRIMGFDKKGVYSLFGLEAGDYILAANNFIIHNRELFPEFITLLSNEKTASIHLLRNNKELLLMYSID